MRATTLVPDPAVVTLEELVADDAGVTLVLRTRRPTTCCPVCDQPAVRIHSWYTRRLADVPWQGLAVCLRLHSRRWFCDNPGCARRIFTERLPTVAPPHAQRTPRLAVIVLVFGVAVGGAPGAPAGRPGDRGERRHAPAGGRRCDAPGGRDAARPGRGRLEPEARPHLRHDPRRPGGASPGRPAPRPLRREPGNVAESAPRCRDYLPRSRRGLCRRCAPGRAVRGPGGRSLARIRTCSSACWHDTTPRSARCAWPRWPCPPRRRRRPPISAAAPRRLAHPSRRRQRGPRGSASGATRDGRPATPRSTRCTVKGWASARSPGTSASTSAPSGSIAPPRAAPCVGYHGRPLPSPLRP